MSTRALAAPIRRLAARDAHAVHHRHRRVRAAHAASTARCTTPRCSRIGRAIARRRTGRCTSCRSASTCRCKRCCSSSGRSSRPSAISRPGTDPVVFDVRRPPCQRRHLLRVGLPVDCRARSSSGAASCWRRSPMTPGSARRRRPTSTSIRAPCAPSSRAGIVVRAANTGISGAVDPYGRVLARTPFSSRCRSTVDVRLLIGRTIYSRLGDVVAWLSLAVAASRS